ncbi:protein BatD [Bizionia gelidisalsuginis]|uniref:Protein BatD n=1 Tax=Bizionia gelidisalsuginis TaxID=291188 RepID=A0ABY3MAY1_9FLAO|nr:BatD family protein [Bizionia gelidisalsuginis]TYC13435.1 protein BatD [Bizionia gelidisalsuginis]
MKLFKHITVLLFLLSTSFVFSQVEFEARVSKKKLGVNERLRVDFSMNQNGDNFSPPSFADFDIIGGPNQSVSNSWINGKRTFKKTYSYFLSPKKQGNYKIEQATIEIEGETYSTSVIAIAVTSAVSRPNDPNTAQTIPEGSIHLVAEVSKTTPYLNEAITVVYKLYVSTNTGVSNWREINSPKFNDFWSQNIEIKGLKIENGKYKGEDYRYVILRKAVLYPQKTGTLEIEPLSLNLTIDIPTNRRDIFGGRLMSQVHKTVSAGSRTIKVKPLPETGKPLDFGGAVGEFNFNVTTSKDALNANESLQAKVAVSGKGNLKLFQLPKLNLPSSLEVYEPEYSEKINTYLSGMQGSITDTYTVVPQYKGKYPIPSISFSYFDLKTESYKRISSNEAIVNVIEGPVYGASDNNIVAEGAPNQRFILNNDEFVFVKTEAQLVSKETNDFFNSTGFWTGLLAPLLAIPFAIVFRRKKEERVNDVVGNRLRKADKLAKRYLSDAKKALGDKEAFYVALEKALHNYLKARLNIENNAFSKEKSKELLEGKQVDSAVILDFDTLLENCELARYTPITNVAMQQDYDKAARTIHTIDKQIK